MTYTADLWFAVGGASSSISVSQVTGATAVPGFSQALQFGRANGNSNTAVINLGQVIESPDSIRCQGQTATLWFWAAAGANWSPASSALNVLFASGTGANQSAANLAAGSWSGYTSLTLSPQQGSAAAAANIAQPITSTWTRYAFTATVPAGCTQLGVLFNATPVGTAAAADYLQIMGVQLEIGAQTTPFEHRDVQVELELAQRYCWVIPEPAAGVIIATGGATAQANHQNYLLYTPVQMRAAPTVSVTTGGFQVAAAGSAATATISAGSTHTPNQITLTSAVTKTVGSVAHIIRQWWRRVDHRKRGFLKVEFQNESIAAAEDRAFSAAAPTRSRANER